GWSSPDNCSRGTNEWPLECGALAPLWFGKSGGKPPHSKGASAFTVTVDLQSLVDGILAGQFRALARAVSLVEREHPDSARLLAEIYPATGK
ncbi:MAG: hypothetical protein DMF57_08365, partial [Acidobacteria bacterium]